MDVNHKSHKGSWENHDKAEENWVDKVKAARQSPVWPTESWNTAHFHTVTGMSCQNPAATAYSGSIHQERESRVMLS